MGRHPARPLRPRQRLRQLHDPRRRRPRHSAGFELHLPESPNGYLLELTGYDTDWDYEIGIDLNAEILRLGYYDVDFSDELALLQDGLSLGNAAITANNRWGTPETLVIPLGLRSVIAIDNTYNPPKTYVWGVRIEGLE